MAKNILLFIGATGFALLVAEAVLTLVRPFDRMQTWIELHDRGFVMNRAGGTAIHELDGNAVTYTFDEHRFRMGSSPKTENRQLTTVLLGDSYAFGLHLPDSSTLAHRMGWRNFAVGGAGTADYLAQMQTFVADWQADTVVVLVSIDDATRTLSKDLNRLDGESQRWRSSSFRTFMESLPGYHAIQRHSYLLNGFIRIAWRNWYFDELSTPPYPSDSLYVAALHKQLYADMRDLCIEAGCTLVLANNGYAAIQPVDAFQQQLLAALPSIADELGLQYEDCSEAVRNAERSGIPMALPTDDHPSSEGIAVLAGCLMDRRPTL